MVAGRIREVIDIANLINPLKEAVRDSGNNLINYITKTFLKACELEKKTENNSFLS